MQHETFLPSPRGEIDPPLPAPAVRSPAVAAMQEHRWVAAIVALQINAAPQSLVESRWNQLRAGYPLWHSTEVRQSHGCHPKPPARCA